MGKFGHTPVSLYTGVAQVSIPIYALKVPGLEIPISLDYHAGGIRVSETASNVGLGWALRAGGLVSSTVVGTADFALSGRGYALQNQDTRIPTDRQLAPGGFNMYTGTGNADYEYLMKMTACPTVSPSSTGGPTFGYDTQPDIFQYNLGSRSGRFFHTQDGQAHPMPFAPLTITRLPGNHTGPWESGNGYRIVDESGNVFTFDQLEVVSTTLLKYGMPRNPADDLYPHSFVYHLGRVQTVRGDVITFTYDTLTYHYQNVTSRTRYRYLAGSGCQNRPESRVESFSVVKSLIIKKITSSAGDEVSFEYSSTRRQDLAGSRALTAIVVQQGNLNRRFELQHGYFGVLGASPDACRLSLESVQEVGKPPYTLAYRAANAVPSRLSSQEDYWGFINGSVGSGDFPADPANGFYTGYSREPDSTAMLTGMLRELHYPTGGFTRFVFEPNGYQVKADSAVTYQSNSLQWFNSDSLASYTRQFILPARRIMPTSILAFYDGPPCNQVTPQFTVELVKGQAGTLVEQYCGQGPAGGRYLSQAGLFAPGDTYTLKLRKEGTCADSYFRLLWQERVMVPVPAHFVCTGGVRIRETQDFDGVAAVPARRQRYYYTMLDTTRSSAQTLNTPPLLRATCRSMCKAPTMAIRVRSRATASG